MKRLDIGRLSADDIGHDRGASKTGATNGLVEPTLRGHETETLRFSKVC